MNRYVLTPGEAMWRPDWWRTEYEPVLKFVREYLASQATEPIPSPRDLCENDTGYYLFGVLPFVPEFTRDWKQLEDSEFRALIFGRINNWPTPVTSKNTTSAA